MIGFDEKTLNYMLDKFNEDGKENKNAKVVFDLAMTYDLDYMASAGIVKDGEFTEEYYDEDDAFDFIIDHIANALPDLDGDDLSELVELYFDYHDAYMEENGLLSWE